MEQVIKTIQEDNVNNARVHIKYNQEIPDVKFEFIQLDSAWKNILNLMIKIWFLRGFYVIGFITFFAPLVLFYPEYYYILAVVFVIYALGIPFLLTIIFVKNKKLRLLVPKLQYFFTPHYSAVINTDNIHLFDFNNNIIKLPLFKNVGLEYEVTEDFSEYLKEVVIIEHPFDLVMNRKKKRNIYLWESRFIYSKKPINGELKLRFS